MTDRKPGWYPDPEMADTVRYWDGTTWTDHRAPAAGHDAAPPTDPKPIQPDAKKPEQPSGVAGFSCLAIVVLSIVVIAISAIGGGGEDDPDGGGEFEAVAQCEGFVDKRLKAPATADYHLTATEQASGWLVTGTVDSENSFGAKVRSNVRCVIHFAGDTAYLDEIDVG